MKTAKFSQFIRAKAKFPTLVLGVSDLSGALLNCCLDTNHQQKRVVGVKANSTPARNIRFDDSRACHVRSTHVLVILRELLVARTDRVVLVEQRVQATRLLVHNFAQVLNVPLRDRLYRTKKRNVCNSSVKRRPEGLEHAAFCAARDVLIKI